MKKTISIILNRPDRIESRKDRIMLHRLRSEKGICAETPERDQDQNKKPITINKVKLFNNLSRK